MDWEDARMFNKGIEEIKSISNKQCTNGDLKRKKERKNILGGMNSRIIETAETTT